MRVSAKPHLAQLQPAIHGGPDYAELARLGIRTEELLDFSVSVNPAPPPAELRELLASVDIGSYPDGDSHALRDAAADCYGVTRDHVLAGNGSSELIWLIGLAFIEPRDQVLVLEPTFGEYERIAHICRATVTRARAGQPEEAMAKGRIKVAFICNPNNPTGEHVSPMALGALARRHPETLLVVDEAYADFVAERPTTIGADMPDNLMVLRSLTKFSGLAGLRLGLVFAQPRLIQALRAVKPPWNVNALAQAAGAYVLPRGELLPDLDALATAKDALVEGLRHLGFKPKPSACNFFLMHVGSGAEFRARLLAQRCLVRDCASFGLPDYVRIAVRGPADNRRLLEALA